MKVIISTLVVSVVIIGCFVGSKVYDEYKEKKECQRLDSIAIIMMKEMDAERERKLAEQRKLFE